MMVRTRLAKGCPFASLTVGTSYVDLESHGRCSVRADGCGIAGAVHATGCLVKRRLKRPGCHARAAKCRSAPPPSAQRLAANSAHNSPCEPADVLACANHDSGVQLLGTDIDSLIRRRRDRRG